MIVPDVTQEEIDSLTQSILVRYGIDFTCYEQKSLRRRIVRVLSLHNLSSVHELWSRILKDPKFIYAFMSEVSVGMTSMFRDPEVWQRLKKRIAVEYHNRESIAVWHAGCSTGEEVYTFGIVLQEANLQEKTTALATDINLQAIEEARAGVYHRIKMIENENQYREYNARQDFSKYYTPHEKYATMNPGLIRHTKFNYHNLITDIFPQGQDLIFCRNVMIYFDAFAKVRLLEKFYSALKPGGYLVIGYFDTMSHLMDNEKFVLVDEKAKLFQKK